MGGVRKPFLDLLGEPVLAHALRPFLADTRVVALVIALGAADADDPPGWLTSLDPRIRVVAGGDTRGESVRNAIRALPDDVDLVAIHDAARPLVTADLVSRCIDVAAGGEGAVAGCPAVDTMKQVDQEGRVLGTPDRGGLWHAHTPQVFPAAAVRRAYAGDLRGATDDASLLETSGLTVRMVDGGSWNLKVTRSSDVAVAEALLRARVPAP
jgi:2-C-methyl-D-erythritol 4-phosphate cytidylyltransferase